MSGTVTLFTPSDLGPFSFQPTFDGDTYTVYVTWNVYGQRWYINIYDAFGNWVLTIAMVGSPDDADIDLVEGYFTSTLVFRVSSNSFEVFP